MEIDLKKLLVAGVRDSRILEESIPPATEEAVSAFEEKIGFRLPEDYRQFLLTVNGGAINTKIVSNVVHKVSALPGMSSQKTQTIGLGYMFTLYDGLAELLNMPTDSGLTLESAYDSYSSLGDAGYPHVPPGCVPISDVYDSGYLLLALDGNYKNRVLYYGYNYFGDPDELYGNVRLAGNSFTEFVSSLYADQ